jgi:hypothetical protein
MGIQTQIINIYEFIKLGDIKENSIETNYKHELVKLHAMYLQTIMLYKRVCAFNLSF